MNRFCWKSRLPAACRRPGQALVEMALSITFVMLLLAAAVDLGLAYKAHQTLVNATAEASSYLDVNPTVNCAVVSCPNGDPIAGANAIARQRFQFEQGTSVRGLASTLDLNANGVGDDSDSEVDITEWVRITEADNTQINDLSLYNPDATSSECRARNPKPAGGGSCYIVIQSRIIYKPFFLRPIIGDEWTIRALSVRRVVK